MNTKIVKKCYETPSMKETSTGKVREAGIVIVIVVGVAVTGV